MLGEIMKFFELFILSCLFVTSAMGIDLSGCEKIGTMGHTSSEGCYLKSDCMEMHKRNRCNAMSEEQCAEILESLCGGNPETVGECIAKENKNGRIIELFRCEKSSVNYQNANSTGITLTGGFISLDGAAIDLNMLANDTENIYVIAKPVGAEFDLNDLNIESYFIIDKGEENKVSVKKID